MTEKRQSVLCVLDIESAVVSILENLPEDVCAAQVPYTNCVSEMSNKAEHQTISVMIEQHSLMLGFNKSSICRRYGVLMTWG